MGKSGTVKNTMKTTLLYTMYIQVRLLQDNKELVCWIPVDKRVKLGVRLTLKGLDGWWDVDRMYSTVDAKPHQDWKVGGLI